MVDPAPIRMSGFSAAASDSASGVCQLRLRTGRQQWSIRSHLLWLWSIRSHTPPHSVCFWLLSPLAMTEHRSHLLRFHASLGPASQLTCRHDRALLSSATAMVDLLPSASLRHVLALRNDIVRLRLLSHRPSWAHHLHSAGVVHSRGRSAPTHIRDGRFRSHPHVRLLSRRLRLRVRRLPAPSSDWSTAVVDPLPPALAMVDPLPYPSALRVLPASQPTRDDRAPLASATLSCVSWSSFSADLPP
jgi:hypothetical protein